MAIIQTPSIANVVEDQTPQLGGSLSTNGSNINVESGDVFYVYNLGTEGDSNYERLEVKWDTNVAVIGTSEAGTGSTRNLKVDANLIDLDSASSVRVKKTGTTQFTFDTSGIYPNIATRDCGTSANRWENVHSQTLVLGNGVDAVLTADSADTLALRNSTTAQAFNVYNTYTDAGNYERLEVKWDTNVATIDSTAAGTGTARSFDISYNGSKRFRGDSAFSYMYQANGTYLAFGSNDFKPQSGSTIELGTAFARWANTYTDTITIGNGVDAILTADAADTLALRNSTTAQQFNIYNTYTDESNYERLEIKWDANVAKIEPTAAGTGTVRNLILGDLTATSDTKILGARVQLFDGGSLQVNIDSGYVTFYNNGIRPSTDSSRNNGISTQRWATTYTHGIATNVETFTAASDTLDAKNNVCLCDCTSNAITLALPAPVSGLQYHIKKIDSTANTVSVEPDDPGPELIDGAIVQTLSSQYDSITVVSDGSNWFVI